MNVTTFNKIIIQGKLSFGNDRTFEKVVDMYDHLIEVRFKNAILVTEEHFNAEMAELNFDRLVQQASAKYFQNSIKLIKYLAQFAISGNIGAWMIDDGQVLEQHFIEPESEKGVVQAYLKGRELSEKSGKENEAIASLDKALKKYDKHSQAYERRGAVNFKLGNLDDAIYDFEKSIKFDSRNADAHMGLGQIKFRMKDYKSAIHHFDLTTKTAVALQPIYWVARRMKAKAHIELEQWSEAELDLRLFTKRKFDPQDMNYPHRDKALSQYGMVLMELGKYEEAIEAFDQALQVSSEKEKSLRAEQLLHRGIAKHKSGGSGYLSDWKEAATLGERQAQKLLDSHKN